MQLWWPLISGYEGLNPFDLLKDWIHLNLPNMEGLKFKLCQPMLYLLRHATPCTVKYAKNYYLFKKDKFCFHQHLFFIWQSFRRQEVQETKNQNWCCKVGFISSKETLPWFFNIWMSCRSWHPYSSENHDYELSALVVCEHICYSNVFKYIHNWLSMFSASSWKRV